MDPYLEACWRDVHAHLIIYACDQLQDHLPPDLRARVEERVFVETPEGPGRSMYPDLRVIERGRNGPSAPTAAGSVAIAEPLILDLPDEPVTQTFIEIVDARTGGRVITVLEVLSLANKQPGPGRELYLHKQQQLKEGGVTLVEIDLLRAGQRTGIVAPEYVPPSHRTPYRVYVRRGWQPAKVGVYRLPLRERLLTIGVPLREADADVPLDLQALIEQCYRNGRYEGDLDYRREPEPPLAPEDAAWADELLRQQGRR
jgi:hypothetical protein